MIPEGERRYIPEKHRGLYITISPDVRTVRHGRLLPCPLAKAAHRAAIVLGTPGAKLAKALSDAHEYYTHSPDIEAHREFQRRVWNWTIAARAVGKDLMESIGQDIAQQLGFTPTPITPPYTPPYPELPKPDCGDLCKLIANACKAPYRCYETETYVSGPGFAVLSDTSIWWGDQYAVGKIVGPFWPTYTIEDKHPGEILYPYSGFYCERGAISFIDEEVFTCDGDYCAFSNDYHTYLIINRGDKVIGPGVIIRIGKIFYLDKKVRCSSYCYFFPKRW